MNAPYYTVGNFRTGINSELLLALDEAGSTVINPSTDSFTLDVTTNMDVLQVGDTTSNPHLTILGILEGNGSFSFPYQLDRNLGVMFNAAWGSREGSGGTASGLLPNFITSYKSSQAYNFVTQGMVWLDTLSLDSSFSEQGRGMTIKGTVTTKVYDPNNIESITDLTAPGTSGTTGYNVPSFINVTCFNNPGSGSTIYDGFTRFALRLSNSMITIPTANVTYAGNQLAFGALPGPFIGSLTITQLAGCSTELPTGSGITYPLCIKIPSNDGLSSDTHHFYVQFVSKRASYTPMGMVSNEYSYRLIGYGSNTINDWSYYCLHTDTH